MSSVCGLCGPRRSGASMWGALQRLSLLTIEICPWSRLYWGSSIWKACNQKIIKEHSLEIWYSARLCRGYKDVYNSILALKIPRHTQRFESWATKAIGISRAGYLRRASYTEEGPRSINKHSLYLLGQGLMY